MRTLLEIAVLAACGSLAVAAPGDVPVSEPKRAAIEKAVLETADAMTAAGEAGDADALFAFVLENDRGVIVQNGQLLTTRAEALERVRADLRGTATVRYSWAARRVTVLSPTLALLVADGRTSVTTTDGRSFTAPLAQTLLFRRTKEGWRVLHAHQSSPVQR